MTKEPSHFNNILLLAGLVVVIVLLGWVTIKNQPANEASSILNQIRPSPTPIVFRIQEPAATSTPTPAVTAPSASSVISPP